MIPKGLADRLNAAVAAAPAGPLGVAVSGGGDSVALLLLMHRFADRPLAAVTVDHGLRPESAAEAAGVATLCARLGVAHATRRWDGRGTGNLQARAREGRRALIAAWAREAGVAAVALGHTLDDQAETFLLRLARGSGVDGLAAMAPEIVLDGVVWLRPLLGERRANLRAWLRAEGVAWADDPTNADGRFDRVRARAALPLLLPLGLGAERLAATAVAMARARVALERATAELARDCLTTGPAGDVEVAPDPLSSAPEEIALRLLAGVLCQVSGARYRPRLAALGAALTAILSGRPLYGLTLHGCVLRSRRGRIAVRREPARTAPPVPLAACVWDGRWRLVACPAGDGEGLAIGALGAAGLAQLPDWRAAGIARETLLATPAIWRGASVIAAPLVREGSGYVFCPTAVAKPPRPGEIVR